jgi:hypothetical protein
VWVTRSCPMAGLLGTVGLCLRLLIVGLACSSLHETRTQYVIDGRSAWLE